MNEQASHKAVGTNRPEARPQPLRESTPRSGEALEPRTRPGDDRLPAQPSAGSRTDGLPATTGGTQDTPTARVAESPNSPLAQMHTLIERAGEVPFPPEVIERLSEPIRDELVDIRPDGLIFVSHPHYRNRLDAAFGVGGWALVPLAPAKIVGNRVVFYGFLKARGQYIDAAYGGHTYYQNNSQQNYDDAVESAKSDCLVRCCKSLPMFRECWDKEYADYWKATYAEEGVTSQSRGRPVWKKRGEAMRDFTRRPDRQAVSEYIKPARLIDEQLQHMEAIKHEGKLWLASKDEFNENSDDYGNELAYEEMQRKSDEFDAVRYRTGEEE